MSAWIGPAIGAGAGLAQSMAGGKDPVADRHDIWGKNYIDDVNWLADQALNLPGREYYQGPLQAPLHPGMGWGYNQMMDFGQNNPFAGLQEEQGRMGLWGQMAGMQQLGNMFERGPQTFQYDQNTFDTTMENLMPGLQGSFDDATRDIMRGLNFNTLPGIDLNSAAAGGFGDSRSDLAAGMATGMAQDRMADIGSQLYQNAVNQAQSAAMSGGSQNLQAGLRNDQTLLQGAGDMARIGLPGLGNAYNTNLKDFASSIGGGQGFMDYQNQLIANDMARYNYNRDQPWNDAAARWNLYTPVLGGGPVASSPGMNPITGIVQGAQMGAGLWDAFSGIGSSNMQAPGNVTLDGMDLGFGGSSNMWGYS